MRLCNLVVYYLNGASCPHNVLEFRLDTAIAFCRRGRLIYDAWIDISLEQKRVLRSVKEKKKRRVRGIEKTGALSEAVKINLALFQYQESR